MIIEAISEISISMIKELIDKNESTFKSINFDDNFKDKSTESLLFNYFWQIGVRWKSCILLVEKDHNISLNILLRSIYELQRKLEFILKDSSKTRTKLLSHQLNYVIEELKAMGDDVVIPDSQITLSKIMEQYELEEISDIVLDTFDDKKWKKYNWLLLFNEGSNFSEMARLLDSEAQHFGNHIYRSLSIFTHANNSDISKFISLESPFEEKISQRTLIYLLTVLSDFELISEMFIEQHYPSYLDIWRQNGRIQPTLQSFIRILFKKNPSIKDLKTEIESPHEQIANYEE